MPDDRGVGQEAEGGASPLGGGGRGSWCLENLTKHTPATAVTVARMEQLSENVTASSDCTGGSCVVGAPSVVRLRGLNECEWWPNVTCLPAVI